MENSIKQLINLYNFHQEKLLKNPEDYKWNNKIALTINKISEDIERNEKFMFFYKDIIKENPDLLWFIGIRIKIFELELWKKMYFLWYNSNKEKKFYMKFYFRFPGW